ncbi:MAG: hypothetical protein L3J96_03135 [Thermoplasmata archaeon]|nr:hypothetical protein [Thermoplasmata archaeon]
MGELADWMRVRGMGRERFAGYLSEFLTGAGYTIERTDSTEPAESRVKATLGRMNPAVPDGAKELMFRFYPTSGGAACVWISPTSVPDAERERLSRLVREMISHVERAVSTESHATAKVTRPLTGRLPWEPEPPR